MASRVEQLREKWESITPRERALVSLLAVTGAAILLLYVAYSIRDGLTAIEKRNETARQALVELDRYRAASLKKTSDSPKVPIPDEAIELSSYLDKIAKEVGITIPRYKSRPSSTKGKFTELSTSIDVRGMSIYQLKDFLQKVETGNKVVVVTELHVQTRYRDKEKLDVSMVVSTFKKADATEKKKKEEG